MLSPTMADAAAIAITASMASFPSEERTDAVMSAVSPGTGTPLASVPTRAASATYPRFRGIERRASGTRHMVTPRAGAAALTRAASGDAELDVLAGQGLQDLAAVLEELGALDLPIAHLEDLHERPLVGLARVLRLHVLVAPDHDHVPALDDLVGVDGELGRVVGDLRPRIEHVVLAPDQAAVGERLRRPPFDVVGEGLDGGHHVAAPERLVCGPRVLYILLGHAISFRRSGVRPTLPPARPTL